MGFIEQISMANMGVLAIVYGPSVFIFLLWWWEQRKQATQRMEDRDRIDRILTAYKADVDSVSRMYENNALLVKNYEKLANELSDVIHLNTQAQTTLVNSIQHNMFCPAVREKAGMG